MRSRSARIVGQRRVAEHWIYISGDLNAEILGEIWPGLMERDHLSAAIGGHLLDPTLLGFGEPDGEVLIALGKVSGVRSLHLRQLVCDPLSHRPAIIGIKPK